MTQSAMDNGFEEAESPSCARGQSSLLMLFQSVVANLNLDKQTPS